MFVFDVREVKNGYIRFSVECEGLIISGFRTTRICNVVMPPEGAYHGRSFHIIKLSSTAEADLLRQVKEALKPKPADIYCSDCGVRHAANYHDVA